MSSSGKKDAGSNKVGGLTARDLEILSKAWGAMKTQPEIDYEKLAVACGMTNPRSASNAWSAIKKKLFADAPAANGDGAAAQTPGSRKRKAAAPKNMSAAKEAFAKDDDDISDEVDAEATPSKKRSRAKPKPKAKSTPAKVKDEEDSSEEEVKQTPVKEKAVKGKAKNLKQPKSEDDSDGPEGADMAQSFAVDDDGAV